MADDLNQSPETKNEQEAPSLLSLNNSPAGYVPISSRAIKFLKVMGGVIALAGVVSGVVLLLSTPVAPYADTRLIGNPFLFEVQSLIWLIHVSLGWGQMIGGIILGVLLNVVAGIGEAVVDIWEAGNNNQIRQ